MRFTRISRLGFVLTIAAALAGAQELSKQAKIERILALTNADAMMNQVFNQMKATSAASLAPGATPERRAKAQQTQEKIMELIKTRMNWEKMRPHYVKIYDETFDAAEIDGMFMFYQSPAGRAMLEKMPALMGKTMAFVQTQMAEIMPEIQRISREAQ